MGHSPQYLVVGLGILVMCVANYKGHAYRH